MIIAVDTGGTKTLVASFNSDGTLRATERFGTPHDQQAYLEQLIWAIQRLSEGAAPRGIAVAVAGVVQHGVAVVCKNLGWYDFDILDALRPAFPETPLWLENDATLGAVGAAQLLPDVPYRLLYVGIGTGLGGGFVVNGQIDPALSDGEISDVHFEYGGKLARWGEILSGKAIKRDFGRYADELQDPSAIDEVSRRIAHGLLTLIPVLRPGVIAFGGRTGASFATFAPGVMHELAALPAQYQCRLLTAPHPEEVVIYGGYFHAIDQLAR